jgi:hypothetical protein
VKPLPITGPTRMGLRAALAAGLSLAIAYFFSLEKAYWATLVSVVIVGETWGQSIQKALERFGMTLLGGMAGWALHHLLGEHLIVRATMLFVCVFFAVYYRSRSYRWMVFYITIYVVFLFSVFGEFSSHLIFVRTYETAIGCAMALLSALVVRPGRASENLTRALFELWAKCEQQTKRSWESVLPASTPNVAPSVSRLSLYRSLLRLHEQRGISMYESFRPVQTTRLWNELIAASRALFQSVVALEEALAQLRSEGVAPAYEMELRQWQQLTDEAFTALAAARVSETKHLLPHSSQTALMVVEGSARDIRRLCRRLAKLRSGMDR